MSAHEHAVTGLRCAIMNGRRSMLYRRAGEAPGRRPFATCCLLPAVRRQLPAFLPSCIQRCIAALVAGCIQRCIAALCARCRLLAMLAGTRSPAYLRGKLSERSRASTVSLAVSRVANADLDRRAPCFVRISSDCLVSLVRAYLPLTCLSVSRLRVVCADRFAFREQCAHRTCRADKCVSSSEGARPHVHGLTKVMQFVRVCQLAAEGRSS